ncbi:hypothetical protein AGR8A_Lc20395 [Agrobacterium fabrum str. J-07]|nr:hypothetical protein AGR8A_Lc20395 [Agrobacterium fabrum str. J-07]
MNHFGYIDGVLHAENVPVPEIAKAVGTPFYVYSTATLERHYKVFSGAFADVDAMVCYAMKANSNQAVLKTLAKLGAGIDVVSGGELRRALAAGVPASRIMFSGVGKTVAEMDYALEAGIYCFNIESEPELEVLNLRAVKAGKRAHVSFRINPDVDARTHAKISTGKKKQVRHFLRAGACGLCPCRHPARHRSHRHRHAYRQPDHRIAAFRGCLPAAARTGGSAAYRWPCDQPRRYWRRPRHSLPRRQQSAAAAGCLCSYRQERAEEPQLQDRHRARPPDCRQCRHSGDGSDLCERWRRQNLRDRRWRHERPYSPDALRSLSRHPPGGAAVRGRAAHQGRYRWSGLRNRRLSGARPRDGGTAAG